MAEDAVNQIGNKLGINTVCETSHIPLIKSKESHWKSTHYFEKVEKKKSFDELICECELITKEDIKKIITDEKTMDFHDFRRRARIGFGPCQGAFCNSRLADFLIQNNFNFNIEEKILDFWEERLKGSIKTCYGDQAKQILLSDYIFQENFGLDLASKSTSLDNG